MLEIERPTDGFAKGLADGEKRQVNWCRAVTSSVEKWREAARDYPGFHALCSDSRAEASGLDALSQESLLEQAAVLHREKMDALPDTRLYPELGGMDQYLDESAAGFARGAGIDVREVYLRRYWRELWHLNVSGRRVPNDVGQCTEHWFPETPNGPLLGKGWDDVMTWYVDDPFPQPPDPPEAPALQEIPPNAEGQGFRKNGTSNEVGMCWEQGGGAYYEKEPERGAAVFPVDVPGMVLQRCATVHEALELMMRYNIFWGPTNAIVGDVEGNGALVEKSKYSYAVRQTSRNVLVTTYGGCVDPDMRALCDTESAVFKYHDRRLEVMKRIVDNAAVTRGLNEQVYWESVLHHDPEAPGCTHRETRPAGIELFTFGAFCVFPRECRSLRRIVSRDGDGLRYGCQNPPVHSRWKYL